MTAGVLAFSIAWPFAAFAVAMVGLAISEGTSRET